MKVTLSTGPAGTQNLRGTVRLTATASPTGQVTRMDFFVGSTLKGSDTSDPFTYDWDTTTVPDGTYTLRADGYFPRNRVESSNKLIVTVKNAVTPPPPPTIQDPPVNTALPVISGDATQGVTLSVSTGSWTNSPTSYTYQWLRCDAAGANALAIAGATGNRYQLVAADVGATIRCAVVAYNSIGPSPVTNTAQTGVVAGVSSGVPVLVAAPVISGTPVVGNTLACSNGSWTQSPTSYQRQWIRGGGAVIGQASVLPDLDGNNANLLIAQKVTLPADATIQSFSFYVVTPAGDLRLGLYTDVGGKPGHLVAATAGFTPVAGWNVQDALVHTALSAGTYWLAYLPSSNALTFRKGASPSNLYYQPLAYGPMPSDFPANPVLNDPVEFSFCATMAGGAAANIPGATGDHYVVTNADVGSTLNCSTIAVNASGSSAAALATPTAVVVVSPPPPPPPPPPAPSNRYTNLTFAAGKYGGEHIEAVFEAWQTDSRLSDWGGTDPDYYDQWGMTQDPNQRVHLFHPESVGLPANPNGSAWASWQELRTTDGSWCSGAVNYNCLALAKSSFNMSGGVNMSDDPFDATWGPGGWPGFTDASERWFAWDILFPLNIGGVSYEFSNSGTGAFNVLGDMHDSGGTNGSPINLEVYPTGNGSPSDFPKYLVFSTTPDQSGSSQFPYHRTNLLQLANADGSRYTANYNVWHEIVIGHRSGIDANGWQEAWCNGVQKLARLYRANLDPREGGPYLQCQNYCAYPTSYVSGATRSAIVYGGLRAGLTRADVQTR